MNLIGLRLTLATLATGSAVVLGQTTAAPSDSLIKELVAILGPLGFLGWYCYHVTACALPAKDAQLAKAQQDYRTELAAEREAHAAIVSRLLDEVRQQREALVMLSRADE